MLKQAILNLVLNSIEAMKNGGNLWLRVSREAGLVVLNVKKTEEGDAYECIQTGQNGSKYRLPALLQ